MSDAASPVSDEEIETQGAGSRVPIVGNYQMQFIAHSLSSHSPCTTHSPSKRREVIEDSDHGGLQVDLNFQELRRSKRKKTTNKMAEEECNDNTQRWVPS